MIMGPFPGADRAALARRFAAALLAMVPVQATLMIVDRPLRTGACRLGIVSYELAGDAVTMGAILESWRAQPPATSWAAFSLGFDYLFMPLYATVIALACLLVARRFARGSTGAALGALLAWGAYLAAACDAVENVALTRALVAGASASAARVAFVAAAAKFALLAAALAYALGGLGVTFAGRRRAGDARHE